MFEGWAAVAVGAAASVVGGAMQGRGASKAADKQAATDKEVVKLQGVEGRKTSAYEAELMDYYSQLNKERNRTARGSMYDKYSKVPKPADYVRAPLMGAKPVNPDGGTTAGGTGGGRTAIDSSTGLPPPYRPEQLAAPRP